MAPVPPEIAFERDPVNAIVVDENIRVTHSMIRDAAKELRSRPADRDGIIHFVALNRRGYSVAIKDGKTFITVLGEPLRVSLKKRLQQTLRDLTPDEHRQRREGHTVVPYVRRPSGELALNVPESYPVRSIRDGKKRRLEDSLNPFIESLVELAYGEKARRAEWEGECSGGSHGHGGCRLRP